MWKGANGPAFRSEGNDHRHPGMHPRFFPRCLSAYGSPSPWHTLSPPSSPRQTHTCGSRSSASTHSCSRPAAQLRRSSPLRSSLHR